MSFLNNTISTFLTTLYGPTHTYNWSSVYEYADNYGPVYVIPPKSNFSYGFELTAKFCVRTFTIGLMIFSAYKGMEQMASNVFGEALKLDCAVKLIQKSPVLYVRAGVISTVVLGGISSLIIEKSKY